MRKLIQQLKNHPLEGLSAIASMAAVVAALAAQQSAERLSNAAMRPHLDITQRIEPYFGIRIDNAGQGAAIIEKFEIYIDGKPTPDIIKDNVYRSALVSSGLSKLNEDGVDVGNALITTIDDGVALKAGSEVFVYKWEILPFSIDEMQKKVARIDIRIVYKSLSGKYHCVLYQGGEFAKYARENNAKGCRP